MFVGFIHIGVSMGYFGLDSVKVVDLDVLRLFIEVEPGELSEGLCDSGREKQSLTLLG